MRERPTSVTIIAWILIVTSGMTLFTIKGNLDNPMVQEMMSRSLLPIPLQYALTYAGLLINFIAGIAMLTGQGWSRVLYVGWTLLGFGINLVTFPMKAALLPGLVILGIMAFFLFRPQANQYFMPGGGAVDA